MKPRAFVAATLAAHLLGAALLPSALLAEPSATTTVGPTPELAAAMERAIALEESIEEHRGERIAIDERIAVTNLRIVAQQEVLANARETLDTAQAAYQQRVIGMYKSRLASPITLLITSESLADFYSRLLMLTQIARRDQQAHADAVVAAAEAEYRAAFLDDLKAQDVALRALKRTSVRELETALAEQQEIVERLTEEARRELEARRATIATTRKQWRESSVALDADIKYVPVVVEPHAGVLYLGSEHQPSHYRSLGQRQTAVCSWYGNEFHGRPTASGQIYNQNDFTCASRTLPFGTRLALTRGKKRIVVVVTDRGPFIAGRDLDLSRAAAQALGFSGVATVDVEFVEVVKD